MVRFIFQIPFFETRLAEITRAHPKYGALPRKLVANNYQYPSNSCRSFTNRGLHWKVDISDFIGHSVYFGLDRTTDALFELCGADSIVFDIGVNIGWTALNLSRICTLGHVFGFEPDPFNYKACSENLRLNQAVNNLTLVPIALGAENGVVSMTIPTPSNRGGNRIAAEGDDAPIRNIRMTTVDDYCKESGIVKVDLIKIDTEGYELRVLKGATRLLQDSKPTLYIEVNDDNLREQGDSALALIEFLSSLGYDRIFNTYTGEIVSANNNFSGCHFDIIAGS